MFRKFHRTVSYIIACVVLSGAAVHLTAQAVYISTVHPIYEFLKRMESRQLLKDYRDAAKPLSRKVIAEHLTALEDVRDKMNNVERETFEYYKTEFSYEITSQGEDAYPTDLRWHLVSMDMYDGIMNVDLNYKLAFRRMADEKLDYRGQGVRLYGYLFKKLGYYFNFVDSRETGNAINWKMEHTPEQGVVQSGLWGAASREYNFTDVQFTYQLGKAELSLEKMENAWGLGTRGALIFSRKPPSYPQFKLRLPLSKSVDFIYIHAQLNSNVLDSARSYHAGSSSVTDFFRPVNRQKYLAAHMLEVTPWNGVDISLGESIVYSDKEPQLMYLIPIMFFKSGEHYNRDTDNAQFFGNLDFTVIRNLNLYASLFIDEIALAYLTDPVNVRNQLGFTLGGRAYDLGMNNLELALEYTRLNPWVYTHKYPSADFTNNGYPLGDWIGQNADNLYAEIAFTPLRELRSTLFYERYRKGGQVDIVEQYRPPAEPFLYGPVRTSIAAGFTARYEIVRDGFLDLKIQNLSITDESPLAGSFKNRIEYSLSASYGLW